MKQGFQKREKKNHAHCQIVYRSDYNFRHVRNTEKWDPPGEPRFISLPVQKAIAVPITAAEQAPQAFLLSRTTGITARGGSRALRDRGRIAANIHILHTT